MQEGLGAETRASQELRSKQNRSGDAESGSDSELGDGTQASGAQSLVS